MSIDVVTRTGWGARHPDGFGNRPMPYEAFVLHHSAGRHKPDGVGPDRERRHVRSLEHTGQTRFGGGISYPWIVMGSGTVYQGLSPNRQGAHTRGLNTSHSAIVLPGNFQTDRLTTKQIEACARLMVAEKQAGRALRARIDMGHQQAPGASTTCPGRHGMDAIPAINARAAALEADPEPDPDWMETHMADGERQLQALADHTGRLASAQRATAQTRAARYVATIRKHYGLDPDPHSDAIWALRIVNGSHTLEDVAERLATA